MFEELHDLVDNKKLTKNNLLEVLKVKAQNIYFRPHGGKPVHTSGCGVCAGKIPG